MAALAGRAAAQPARPRIGVPMCPRRGDETFASPLDDRADRVADVRGTLHQVATVVDAHSFAPNATATTRRHARIGAFANCPVMVQTRHRVRIPLAIARTWSTYSSAHRPERVLFVCQALLGVLVGL